MGIKGTLNSQDGVRVGPFLPPVAEGKNVFTGEHVGKDIMISLCESIKGTCSDAKKCLDSRINKEIYGLYLCPVRLKWGAETA